ncbi:NAD(P)-binding protein [Actinomyces culturomici]|uniref:NAD(P)-binding protein n=1 Tax=Actinomyces culturomici TaxID=1926276 RepID=UPI0038B3A8FB
MGGGRRGRPRPGVRRAGRPLALLPLPRASGRPVSEGLPVSGAGARIPDPIDLVVIGAGQAGLAAAGELVHRGMRPSVDFLVLDAEEGPGGAWRHRWDSLTVGKAHRSPTSRTSMPARWTRIARPRRSPPSTTAATRRPSTSPSSGRCACAPSAPPPCSRRRSSSGPRRSTRPGRCARRRGFVATPSSRSSGSARTRGRRGSCAPG